MMTAEQLKGAILQLAMQGKLVEQRPEEGTGEELYQKIQAEKSKLIKERKIKNQKPLPEINEEEIPYEIPESWRWKRVDSVISLLSGADLTPDKYNSNEKGVVYITGASNIENGKVLVNRWTEYPRNIAHTPASATPLMNGTGAVGTSAKYAREDHVHPSDTSKANLASPTFTGTPKAPTAAAGTNTTQIATTAFVTSAIASAQTGAALFKGTASAGTDISSLTAYKKGWYWVVATAGTYAGQSCEAGDMIFCVSDYSSSYKAADFSIVQNNIVTITNAEIDTIVAS